MKKTSAEDQHILHEAEKIGAAIGKMFPGICEVVVHDLTDPEHSIRLIENNLSGRKVGDPATERSLRRIADPTYPEVVQNYLSEFPDGRPMKCTAIGLKNREGDYVASICLNLDVSSLSPLVMTLSNLISIGESEEKQLQTLRDRNSQELREVIESFAAERAHTPRSLGREAKKELVRRLHSDGYFDSRNSTQTISNLLGMSRATVYNYTK